MNYCENRKYITDSINFVENKIDDDNLCCQCFLISTEGKQIGKVLQYDCNIFSPSDDLTTLSDGSLIWPFADHADNLYLCILTGQFSTNFYA